jgi:hypothetical protein
MMMRQLQPMILMLMTISLSSSETMPLAVYGYARNSPSVSLELMLLWVWERLGMLNFFVNTKEKQSRSNNHRCPCNLSPNFPVVLSGFIYFMF